LLLVSTTVLIAGGAGTWAWIHSDNSASTCATLLEDSRIQDALGSSPDRDLTCTELSMRLKEAAIGSPKGVHSMEQAQAMRDILSATDDAAKENGHSVDPSLRMPLAELLANYVSDTHEILKQLDSDYVVHVSDKEPWQDKDGVHMTVAHESLIRVMKAVSEDPSAYAKIREAEGRYSAENLISIPAHAKGASLSVPACGNALALGSLDGIAADITNKLSDEEAARWEQKVTTSIASSFPSDVPSYKSDPVNYVTGTWAKQIKESEKDFSTSFGTQAVDYIRIWAKNRAEGSSLSQNLAQECQADADRSRSETTDFLEGA
jgi:hypothetical protein